MITPVVLMLFGSEGPISREEDEFVKLSSLCNKISQGFAMNLDKICNELTEINQG